VDGKKFVAGLVRIFIAIPPLVMGFFAEP